MKSKMKIKTKVVGSIACLSMILFMGSCAGDGFDEETFSGGVTNTQLDSPKASDVAFEKLATTENNVKVTWSVVMGAGGYKFSMYIVDDPDHRVAVVKDSIVDGTAVVCPWVEDTNYKVEIAALGYVKLNNTASVSATEISWSTLVAATLVPNGTDLTTYFAEHPVTTGKDTEVAFELEAGGTYYISGDLNFGVNNVQLRGNKTRGNANVKFTAPASIITCGGGLALKFINFDCDVVTDGAFLKFGDVPEEILDTKRTDHGKVTNPMVIQSCNIKAVRKYLVHINGKKYGIQNFAIRNCVIDCYQAADLINFNSSSSIVKDFEISNSTIYSHNQNGSRFLRYGGGQTTSYDGWSRGSMTFISNTFYNLSYSGQSFNGNGWSQTHNEVISKNNLFIDSFSGNFNRRIRMQGTKVAATFENNCYWYNGALPLDETSNRADGDKSNSAYGVDPGFADAANGDFTPSAPEVFAHGSGDPRWLN